MFKSFGVTSLLLALILISGCAGLGTMKEVQFQTEARPDMATVNIVRRAIFMGDGAKVEVWDGDKFIGTLGAGRVLQYYAKPGKHTFMTYVQGSWAAAKGELKPGKAYYLKFNVSGFGPTFLGAAKANDPRIAEWNMMKAVAVDNSSTKPVPEKYVLKAREVLRAVESGQKNATHITDSNAL